MSDYENNYLKKLASGTQVQDPYYGLFSVFDNSDKFIAPVLTQEEQDRQLLFTKYHKFKDYKVGTKVINTNQEFEKYFDLITNNVFLCMDWKNVLIAGGSILSLISSVPEEYKTSDEKIQEWFRSQGNFGDIDIFLYGLTDRQATKKIFEIYESIKNVIPKDILCVRGPRAITFVMGNPYRHIQIILRNFKTLPEILLSFDVDSCAFGYDGEKVWCSDRSCYAITRATNIVNITKKSPSYEYRLTKYGKRGYAVYIPNFTEDNLNEQIYLKPPHQLKGLSRLLVLEKLDDNVKYQIYKDVLDLHQASMRKNLNHKSEYEDSDYSKIYLPEWTENFTLDNVQSIMKQKFTELNKNSGEFIKHYCFYGKLNDVIMGKTVKIPTFETPEDRQNYEKSFVSGRMKFHSITDSDFKELGVFSSSCLDVTDSDITEWYQSAYHETTNKNTVIEYVVNNQPDKIVELIEGGRANSNAGKTEEEYQIWKRNMLNSRDIANRVPLHQAIFKEDEAMVFLLLEYGADISYVSKLGKSALHTACEVGNVDIVKRIVESQQVLDNKALINAQDSYKLTPILYSLMYGNIEVFKYLYKYAEPNDLIWTFKYDKNKNYRALKMCLLFRQYEIAKFLLNKGYDINDHYDRKIRGSVHIIEDSVKAHDLEMFNILINYHTSRDTNGDDSGLKYKLENLQYLSKELQQKYNKASTKQSRDYYVGFITRTYEVHRNKNALYDLLSAMIVYHRFDDFKDYVKVNEVNLSLVNNGESLLDNVESKISWVKSNIAETKNKIKVLQLSQGKQILRKYQYSTGQIECDDNDIYVVPSWIIENEVSHVINSTKPKQSTSKKAEISDLEKQLALMVENIEYYEKVKKYLATKGVVSMIKQESSMAKAKATAKKSCVKEESESDESDLEVEVKPAKTSKITKTSNLTNSANSMINISVMYDDMSVDDQQTYLELFNDINNGSNLDEYELAEFRLDCYLSKSKLTPLQASLLYENYEAFNVILKHMMANQKVVNEKKQKVVRNNLKLKQMVDKKASVNLAESDNDEESEIRYTIKHSDLVNGLMKIISGLESESALSYFLIEMHLVNDFFEHITKSFWNYIKMFTSDKSYGLITELIRFYDERKLPINMNSQMIVNAIFADNDLEGVMTFFKAIKQAKNCKFNSTQFFNQDILMCYIEEMTKNKSINMKSKVPSKIIKSLLELQPTLLDMQINGTYPIILSAGADLNILELIIQQAPDMNVFDSKGYYAIHMAVTNNKIDNAKLIMTNCPDHVNKQTLGQLKTPLMIASSSYGEMIDLIFTFSPNENLLDVFGNSSLHYGTMRANIFLVNKLKFHNMENYMRMTPSDYIINNYKSYFHHIRNEKLGLQLDKKKLSFIVEIYKKYIAKQSNKTRVIANYSDVVKVNKYILNSIPEGVKEIPDILKV